MCFSTWNGLLSLGRMSIIRYIPRGVACELINLKINERSYATVYLRESIAIA